MRYSTNPTPSVSSAAAVRRSRRARRTSAPSASAITIHTSTKTISGIRSKWGSSPSGRASTTFGPGHDAVGPRNQNDSPIPATTRSSAVSAHATALSTRLSDRIAHVLGSHKKRGNHLPAPEPPQVSRVLVEEPVIDPKPRQLVRKRDVLAEERVERADVEVDEHVMLA